MASFSRLIFSSVEEKTNATFGLCEMEVVAVPFQVEEGDVGG